MQLECFTTMAEPPKMIPGRPERKWMDAFAGRAPYRCLPLTMANTTGWEILCPFGFTAEWSGAAGANAIRVMPDAPAKDLKHLVTSHFAYGTLTFHTGYLFRTPPGWAVLASGPPNHIKHGIQPLTGLVETDWLPFPFTMNWLFTAPGRVRFEKDEPFCFVNVVEHNKLERVEPVLKSLDADPELKRQYETWSTSRAEFNQQLKDGDPDALKRSWQKFYFRGETLEGDKVEAHVNKRRLKTPEPESGGNPSGQP